MNKPRKEVREIAYKKIGELLRERQQELGLPIEQMARIAEISKQSIYSLFEGKPATMEVFFKIMQILDMHIDLYPKELGKFDGLTN